MARYVVGGDNIGGEGLKDLASFSLPADIVVFDAVLAAAAFKSDAEINVSSSRDRRRTFIVQAAISVEGRLVHPILVAVHEANPAASGSIRTSRVVDPKVFFEVDLRS